ncbi:16S rRNA (guanine(966)-N(2))-methyltransferase RsmD [Symbiobacterium thermophilum]|uniref:16S rRNA (Guanine(966)-N(2))-methyltransferase RsmD n=2 Tax=Symbiobacterium thermophilum TaxID=2734 RepID=A0A953I2X4_SYMTR|nr:16S rRNA (guanine(966)-N(2))-methyltransferase RsmD [Symbiobacterium thermophilum]MBY6275952.1 16S rRNA (guanine(966)-N(2))-methyltransferase RsmD [Symbiobacterium thermophilum]BAD40423.1 putative RNA methylase [Symbiobacterium thermophilum IAM 14863]
MRVITGSAKGRPLKTVKSRAVRPTSDRVKESLFNIIGSRVVDADFLDLFAGSGAVGIEALSRGARACVFVELQTAHLKVVADNLRTTGLAGRAELIRRDARAALVDLAHRGRRFDFIFVDPPYGQDLVPAVLALIDGHGVLAEDGWVICEHHAKDPVPAAAGGLYRFREVLFGETMLSIYRADARDAGGQNS